MMSQPKVSVLMPVYNGEKYLSQAIDSILNQDYQNWELVVINDGSKDDSVKIIQSYSDQRIRFVDNGQNIGLVETLNKGIDLCSGEYIARMDADDISLPVRLGLQVAFLDANPRCGICGGNAEVIDGENQSVGSIKNICDNRLLKINLLFSVPFIHPCMMIRKEVFDKFRYDARFKHVEDYDLWCRISRKWEVANLPFDLLKYRWHDSNVSVVNDSHQDDFKKKIIKRELIALGIEPTDDELYAHQITFKLYAKGEKLPVAATDFNGVSDWFLKLTEANFEKKVYDQHLLISYLWARWLVLCLSQKKYFNVFPRFASLHPAVLIHLLKLLSLLRKK